MNTDNTLYDTIIIGSGPAAYTAAIYASRANMKTLVLEGWEVGGLLTKTTEVENFPGFPGGVLGGDLMESMRKQAENCGAELLSEMVEDVDPEGMIKTVTTEEGDYYSRTVIIATGSSPRMLGIPGEDSMLGRGVSTCATCDGTFFTNKTVAVVGGGDSAMEEALYLSNIADHVTIIHRSENFRASAVMLQRAKNTKNIEFVTNTTVEGFHSEDNGTLRSLFLKNTDGTTTTLNVDGLFIAVGHTPNTSFLPDIISTDELGYIKTFEYNQTNIPGVFACGDVVDSVYQQAITAAGDGCKTALDVVKLIEESDAS